MEDIIKFIMTNVPSILCILTIGITLYETINKNQKFKQSLFKNTMRYMVGVLMIWAAVGHVFFAKEVSASIGWQSNGFQWEVAMADLALGILGIMASTDTYINNDFTLATLIFATIFMWGAAGNHLKEIIINKNYNPGNAGPVLYIDAIVPIILLASYN